LPISRGQTIRGRAAGRRRLNRERGRQNRRFARGGTLETGPRGAYLHDCRQGRYVECPPYQETIEFRADSTFRRFRSNGYEATGKYTTRRFGPDDQGILATFDDPKLSYHELSGTRQNSATEGEVYLRQQGPDVLVESYVASDGPAFYYEKVKE
jgi:hypothetical protein